MTETNRWHRRRPTGVLLVAAISTILVAARPVADAGIVEVAIVVELSCPSCAQGLERRLGRLDGVDRVEVRVDAGRVVLVPQVGADIDLDAVWQQVRNAGFTPDAMLLVAVGRIETADGVSVLVLPGPTRLAVEAGAVSLPAADRQPVLVRGSVAFPGGGVAPRLRVDVVETP